MKKHDDLANFLMQKVFSYITKHAKFQRFFMSNRCGYCSSSQKIKKPKNWNLGIGFNIKAFLS